MNTQNNNIQSIQLLTDLTKRMALEHDFAAVSNCMHVMGKLYDKGNEAFREAVENIFIFSFSSLMYACNTLEWKMVQSYMPPKLHAAFVAQVLRSNC